MAKTYTLTATMYGARKTSVSSTFSGFSSTDTPRLGANGTYVYATSFFFDSTTMSKLRALGNSGIQSITLSITHSASSHTRDLYYGAKSSTSTSTWDISSSNTLTNGLVDEATSTTINLTSIGIPASYAYVVGGAVKTAGYGNISAATLTVVTKEVDYKLSYNANGGNSAPSSQIATGVGSVTFTISTTEPTRINYTFKGWATSESATEAEYSAGSSITISSNTTLYAVWEPLPGKLYFDAQGGSECAPIDILIDNPYGVLPTPIYLGHVFLGWSPYPSREHLFIDSSTIVPKVGNFLVFAQWARDGEIFIDTRDLEE